MSLTAPARPARATAATLALALLTLLPAAPAWAHNDLRTASPGRDATLTAAPTEVSLEFAQRLDPTFTTIVVTDPARRPVAAGAPAVTGTRGTVALGRLPGNGTYTVAYRVVSVDGHPVQGSYPFTLAVPGAPAAPVAAVTPPVAGRADGTGAPTPAGTRAYLGLGAGLVVLAGGGYLLWRRRRRGGEPAA